MSKIYIVSYGTGSTEPDRCYYLTYAGAKAKYDEMCTAPEFEVELASVEEGQIEWSGEQLEFRPVKP